MGFLERRVACGLFAFIFGSVHALSRARSSLYLLTKKPALHLAGGRGAGYGGIRMRTKRVAGGKMSVVLPLCVPLSLPARMGLVDVVHPPENAAEAATSSAAPCSVPPPASLPASRHAAEGDGGTQPSCQRQGGGEADRRRTEDAAPPTGACTWAVREVVTLFSFVRDKVGWLSGVAEGPEFDLCTRESQRSVWSVERIA